MADSYWNRFQRRQMSRRRMLAATGGAGVGLAGLTLVGCGDDDDDDDDDAAPEDTAEETGDDTEDDDEEAEATTAPDDIPTGGTIRVPTGAHASPVRSIGRASAAKHWP